MVIHIRRREFISLLGGAAAWPLSANAQQATMPIIGIIGFFGPISQNEELVPGFRQGLKEAGFIEGENVSILYRPAGNEIDRLLALADDLARRRVAVIVAFGYPATFAAKAATTTIPIVFVVAEDPVRLDLVASLPRPGGNLTGVNFFGGELAAKRLELLHELVPAAARVAVLVDPANATTTETTLRDLEPAARAMGLEIQVLNASNGRGINAAFAPFVRDRPDALFVSIGAFFTARRVQLATLSARHMIPMASGNRRITEVGGLMSYGTNLADANRQIGVYAGRILKGAKPADLPVVQSTKFELVINTQTAEMLGLTVPPSLLARADEVIE